MREGEHKGVVIGDFSGDSVAEGRLRFIIEAVARSRLSVINTEPFRSTLRARPVSLSEIAAANFAIFDLSYAQPDIWMALGYAERMNIPVLPLVDVQDGEFVNTNLDYLHSEALRKVVCYGTGEGVDRAVLQFSRTVKKDWAMETKVRKELEVMGESELPQEGFIKNGELEIDFGKIRVILAGRKVRLTPKDFHLLGYLARKRGIFLPRGVILGEVWGEEWKGNAHLLDVHISRLRGRLGVQGWDYIECQTGYGLYGMPMLSN